MSYPTPMNKPPWLYKFMARYVKEKEVRAQIPLLMDFALAFLVELEDAERIKREEIFKVFMYGELEKREDVG